MLGKCSSNFNTFTCDKNKHRNQNNNNVRHTDFQCTAPLYISHGKHSLNAYVREQGASTAQLHSNRIHKDPNGLQILIQWHLKSFKFTHHQQYWIQGPYLRSEWLLSYSQNSAPFCNMNVHYHVYKSSPLGTLLTKQNEFPISYNRYTLHVYHKLFNTV